MGTESRDWWKPTPSSYRMGLEAKERTFLLSVQELVGLFRNVPRYRGQDVSRHPAMRASLPTSCSRAEKLNQGGTTKASRFSSLCG
jgi:hypothetical protein